MDSDESSDSDDDGQMLSSADEGSDDEGALDPSTNMGYADVIETELDAAYEQFNSRRKAAATARKAVASEDDDDLYAPIGAAKTGAAAQHSELIGSVPEGSTSRAASLWFQQPMFAKATGGDSDDEADDEDIEEDDDEDDVSDQQSDSEAPQGGSGGSALAPPAAGPGGGSLGAKARKKQRLAAQASSDFEAEPNSFGVARGTGNDSDDDAGSEVDDEEYDSDDKAMVSAMAPIMLRKKDRDDFIDAGYNRYANNDDESILPKWFVDDERKHHKPNLPITKEEAIAMRIEKKVINNRPIKKVAEAKARKKRKESRAAEKVKQKAEAISEAEGVSAKSKMRAIEKLMKAAKAKKPDATYVATAKIGGSKIVSNKGRASGGRTMKVDRRMKTDKRGSKASAMRAAGKRSKKPKHR